MTLTWLENGSRFSVFFEVPPDMQVDFDRDHIAGVLVAVAEDLRPGR